MIVTGTVKKTNKGIAETEIARSTACGDSCASCGLCPGMNMKVNADNAIGAREGDTVLLSMSDKKVLGAAFLVYVIPVIMLIIGYIAGNALFKTESGAIGIGFALMVLSFAAIAVIDRKVRRHYVPKIIKIVTSRSDA
ncbi:MAG: SoxR reducing system RseC family protein [Clostridia bacterium]|nr:SoxR reducing system RseC family protein [Clostridia bacterium]